MSTSGAANILGERSSGEHLGRARQAHVPVSAEAGRSRSAPAPAPAPARRPLRSPSLSRTWPPPGGRSRGARRGASVRGALNHAQGGTGIWAGLPILSRGPMIGGRSRYGSSWKGPAPLGVGTVEPRIPRRPPRNPVPVPHPHHGTLCMLCFRTPRTPQTSLLSPANPTTRRKDGGPRKKPPRS